VCLLIRIKLYVHPDFNLLVNSFGLDTSNCYFMLTEEEDAFQKWLEKVVEAFKDLSSEQQLTTFHTLLRQCSPNQRYNVSKQISGSLYQDILISLPTELLEQICHYIDAKSLVSACCVSKDWNGCV